MTLNPKPQTLHIADPVAAIWKRYDISAADAPHHILFPGGRSSVFAPIVYKGDKNDVNGMVKFLEENHVHIVSV